MPIEEIFARIDSLPVIAWLAIGLLPVAIAMAALWVRGDFSSADKQFPLQSSDTMRRAGNDRKNAIAEYLDGRVRRRSLYAQRRRARNDIDYEFVLTVPVSDPKLSEFIEAPPSLRDFDNVQRGFIRTIDDFCGHFVRLLHELSSAETAAALARVVDSAILVDSRYRRTASSIAQPETTAIVFSSRPFFDRIYLESFKVAGRTHHLAVIECEEGFERYFQHLLGGPKKRADRAWLGVGIRFARPEPPKKSPEVPDVIQCRAMRTRARALVNGEVELRTPVSSSDDPLDEPRAWIIRRGAVSTNAAAEAGCVRVRVRQVRGDDVNVFNTPALALLDAELPDSCLDERCQPQFRRGANPPVAAVETLVNGALPVQGLFTRTRAAASHWQAQDDVGAWYDERTNVVQRFPSFRVTRSRKNSAAVVAGQWLRARSSGGLAGIAAVGHERNRRDDFAIVHYAHWLERYLREATAAHLMNSLPTATSPIPATSGVIFRAYG